MHLSALAESRQAMECLFRQSIAVDHVDDINGPDRRPALCEVPGVHDCRRGFCPFVRSGSRGHAQQGHVRSFRASPLFANHKQLSAVIHMTIAMRKFHIDRHPYPHGRWMMGTMRSQSSPSTWIRIQFRTKDWSSSSSCVPRLTDRLSITSFRTRTSN